MAGAIKMATKGKHRELTLKVKYKALSDSISSILILIEEEVYVSLKKNLYILLFLSLYNTLHREETFPAYFFQNLAEII